MTAVCNHPFRVIRYTDLHEIRTHFNSSVTFGAPIAPIPFARLCFPAMAFFTFPPDDAVALCRHILRAQIPVLIIIPLLCKLRHGCLQVIYTRYCLAAWAHGAAIILSRVNCRAPAMPFGTFPPYFFPTARHHIFRSQFAILVIIPFRSQCRIQSNQIIFTRYRPLTGTIRTASLMHCPVWNVAVPAVPVLTFPPYLV